VRQVLICWLIGVTVLGLEQVSALFLLPFKVVLVIVVDVA
jgi:hypothetical protein